MCRRMRWPGCPQGTSLDSARAQRHHQLAALVVAEAFEVERGVTLVTEQFDQCRAAFFHRRLNLPLGDTYEVHLEGFG